MDNFDYTGRDYTSLREQLISYVRSRVPLWSADPSDFGTVLLEASAYMGDMLSYYVDIAAQESNVLSANSPSNILSHAQLFGYQPSLAISAEVPLRVTYNDPSKEPGEKIDVGGREVFDPGTGLSYEIRGPVSVPNGSSADVLALEGSSYSALLGKSNGAPNQRLGVPLGPGQYLDGRVGTTTLTSTVGAVVMEWRATYNLLDAGPDDRVYALVADSAGNTQVLFGDGNSGAVPQKDANIVLQYRMCSGSLGNTPSAGSIKQFLTSYDNPSLLSSGALSVVNIAAPSGGTDLETIESIRENVVKYARSQRRIVSVQDYGRIARAEGEVLSAAVSAEVWSQPRLFILPRQESLLSAAATDTRRLVLLRSVAESVKRLCMVGTSPVVQYGRVAVVHLDVELNVWPTVDLQRAADLVRQKILYEFSYGLADLGRGISEDMVLQAVRAAAPDTVVRFAQVNKIYGDKSLVWPLETEYMGGDDGRALQGVRPKDGVALVVTDASLRILVHSGGRALTDERD